MDNSLRLLQLTDLHLKADAAALMENRNIRASLQSVVERCRSDSQWPPDLICVTGDIADDETAEGYRQTYQWLARELGQYAPVCAIPGNHDDANLLADCYAALDIKTSGSIELGDWQVILLDSSVPGRTGGELDSRQLALFRSAVENSKAGNSVVLLHHPLIDLSSPWMDSMKVKNGAAFIQLAAGYEKIAVVLTGHAHQAFDQSRSGIRLLGTPATCPVQFKPQSREFATDDLPPGGRWLTLNNDGTLETEVVRVLPS